MKIDSAKQMFDQACHQWENQNLGYNPQLKHKDIFVDPRVDYMTEVLRQQAHTNKRIVALVDLDLLPFIEDKWRSLPKSLRALDHFLKIPAQKE